MIKRIGSHIFPFLFISLFSTVLKVKSQDVLQVSNNPLEEISRQRQLTSMSTNSLLDRSMMVRPIFGLDTSKHKKISIRFNSLQHLQQNNLKNPIYYNDGLMYPTKGWQGYYSLGAAVEYKNFYFDIKPEYVWVSNQDFQGFPTDHYNIIWKSYYEWLNRIDMPQQFKDRPISKLTWGQTILSYTKYGVSIGISNKNLWWGPGRFQSLVMSNHSSGFKYIDFHSQTPLKTPIGKFEWQMVLAGKLMNSNTPPIETMRAFEGVFLYNPKDSIHQRKINGGVITWQPKWLPGLFIGTDGLIMHYKGLEKSLASMGSFFARYILPEDHAEVYIQYGRSDKLVSPLNILKDTIPRGYLAGVRKLFPFRSTTANRDYLQVGIEVLQLGSPNIHLINGIKSWYVNNDVRQGFTQDGQVLGAAAGPGSNVQKIDIAWIRNKNKIGFEFERWQHNADFYYQWQVNSGSFDFNRHWIDLSATLVGSVSLKNALFFWNVSGIRSINYYWKSLIPQPVTPQNYFSDGWDLINMHARVGVIWNINKYLVK